MSKNRINGLIALNAVLLCGLAVITLAPDAEAQARRARAHGQYAMVDAKFLGREEAAIIIIDSSNQEMLAIQWDRNRKMLTTIGQRDLGADAVGGKGGR